MPYIGNAYLISRTLLDDPVRRPSFINKLLEPDMAFCANLRDNVRQKVLLLRNYIVILAYMVIIMNIKFKKCVAFMSYRFNPISLLSGCVHVCYEPIGHGPSRKHGRIRAHKYLP